jgi:hypothetical protein
LYLLPLFVLLLRCFFNFVAPTCSAVVLVYLWSVGDIDCLRGMEKRNDALVGGVACGSISDGRFDVGFSEVVRCVDYLRCWMHFGIVVLMLLQMLTSVICCYFLPMISGDWIFSLDKWCETMRSGRWYAHTTDQNVPFRLVMFCCVRMSLTIHNCLINTTEWNR